MPELPEVETVRRGLEPVLTGQRFTSIEQRRKDLRFPLPERFAERLTGRRIERLDRRAKYLLVHLEGAEVLSIHLGMSGRLLVSQNGAGSGMLGRFTHDQPPRDRHDHVVFHISNGVEVVYNDARRFGSMDLIAADRFASHKSFACLGVEPISDALTSDYIAGAAKGRTTDLKAFLMDQQVIAGLGNIYVCEALFHAHLSPRRRAATLADRKGHPRARALALVEAIREVLRAAIAAGGSSLRDYRQTSGELGNFQTSHAVYERTGAACTTPGCAGSIRRIVQAGRSTFYCPRCQR